MTSRIMLTSVQNGAIRRFYNTLADVMNVKAHRRQEILRRLEQNSFARVEDLAAELGCSQMTIRRDLAELDAEGLVERSRGGAAVTRRVRLDFALYERSALFRSEKIAIGRAAAAQVKNGERILLDTGTTTLTMARALRGRTGISVVTTSLAIVSELLREPGIECMLLGGIVRDSSPDLYGPLLEDNLARLHADRAFVGCDGLSNDGVLMTTDPRVARASALMIENSAFATLLTDSSKAGRNSFISFAKLGQLDCLITDPGMPRPILHQAREAGVETVIVSP